MCESTTTTTIQYMVVNHIVYYYNSSRIIIIVKLIRLMTYLLLYCSKSLNFLYLFLDVKSKDMKLFSNDRFLTTY